MKELRKCPECEETFVWDDRVAQIKDEFYHENCVILYPTGYVVYTLDHEFIGPTDDDADFTEVYDCMEQGEYEEECECGSGELTNTDCCG